MVIQGRGVLMGGGMQKALLSEILKANTILNILLQMFMKTTILLNNS